MTSPGSAGSGSSLVFFRVHVALDAASEGWEVPMARCVLQPLHDKARLRVGHSIEQPGIKCLIFQLRPYSIGACLCHRIGNLHPILPCVGGRRRSEPPKLGEQRRDMAIFRFDDINERPHRSEALDHLPVDGARSVLVLQRLSQSVYS